jgi:hypothetical protein
MSGQRKVNRGTKSQSRTLPPPVGGWNARDALASMGQEDAVILQNIFPKQSEVATRGGYTLHCNTANSAAIKTLAEYKVGTTRKLVAAVNGKLIDVSTSTPSNIGTGFTNDTWRWVIFGGKIFLVNGIDAPQDWDGTTLTATAWSGSGLTITNLSDVLVFKERMFFIEKNTQSFWYASATKVVTGTLTKFDLRYVGNFGGTLVGMGSITQDGGNGADDLLALYFSSGEVVIYSGSDPGDATDWSIAGRFVIGAPVNAQPIQFGSDLVSIINGAYVPLTKVASLGRANPSSLDLSDKISGEVAKLTALYSGNTGWQAVLYPKGRKLLFNVPLSSSSFEQHVMNIDTKAWCKFTGWNFPCFGLFNDHLYGGSTDGKVYKVDNGVSDNGEPIPVDIQWSWNYFGDRGRQKQFNMINIIFTAAVDPSSTYVTGVDFQIEVPSEVITLEDTGNLGAEWDIAEWNVAEWSGQVRVLKGWNGANGLGYCFSLRARMFPDNQPVTIQAATVIMSPAGLT